jgi:uncharacterized protein (DUF433 family)
MERISLEPGKRGGRPCIRGLRISVYDVLSMLSNGMSQDEVLDDFPELTREDILAALAYAADREHQVYSLRVQRNCFWMKTCPGGLSRFSSTTFRDLPKWYCWAWSQHRTKKSGNAPNLMATLS